MRLRTELKDSHLYRLHQLDRPVVVEVRAATVTVEGLERLREAAEINPRHRFTAVVKSSTLRRSPDMRVVWSKLRNLDNVYVESLDDENVRGRVIAERGFLHDELARRAAAAIAQVEDRA